MLLPEVVEIPTTPATPTEATMEVDTPMVMAIMVHLLVLVVATHMVTQTDHHPLLLHRMGHHKCLDHLLQAPHRVATDLLRVHERHFSKGMDPTCGTYLTYKTPF
jgi:hypothetical protein